DHVHESEVRLMTETTPERKTWRCLDCGARTHTPPEQAERPPCRKDPAHKRCVPVQRDAPADALSNRLLRVSRELTAVRREMHAAQKTAGQAARGAAEAEEARAQALAGYDALAAERDAACAREAEVRQELEAARALMTEGEQQALARLEQAEAVQARLTEEAEALGQALGEVREERLAEQTRLLGALARWQLAFWALAGASALSHLLLLVFR
ncbi:MAG TPA: hypothetical protein VFU47_01540, partial [Armatimonadota bacterium]|nr:hypothetical protein [Armatimonadota bacterium]